MPSILTTYNIGLLIAFLFMSTALFWYVPPLLAFMTAILVIAAFTDVKEYILTIYYQWLSRNTNRTVK